MEADGEGEGGAPAGREEREGARASREWVPGNGSPHNADGWHVGPFLPYFPSMRHDHRNAHHLATISYDGRFWDAYLEIDEPSAPDAPVHGRIVFSAADEGAVEPVRTTSIFIEDSPQEVLTRAREFKTHQLVALLRSAIPTEAERDRHDPPPDSG